MAFSQTATRLLGKYPSLRSLLWHANFDASLVPLGIAAATLQASIYDVPGGFRAVMFDRFAGVKDQVRRAMNIIGHV